MPASFIDYHSMITNIPSPIHKNLLPDWDRPVVQRNVIVQSQCNNSYRPRSLADKVASDVNGCHQQPTNYRVLTIFRFSTVEYSMQSIQLFLRTVSLRVVVSWDAAIWKTIPYYQLSPVLVGFQPATKVIRYLS